TGAKLTTNIQDIVEEIPCLQQMIINQEEIRRISQVNNETLDEQAKLLLDNIGYEPVSYDEIIINSGITVEKLRVMLPELELKDLIQSTSGGRFVRK
ncbi:MAG: hypothetical protein HKN08_05800, partial [Gammaproteobacteria bacterium]|nr:hypothetical protein [Gammaproteobacteria bacterium]